MEFGGNFLETFLEGSVDHIIYRDYLVNQRFFFLFTLVWPVCSCKIVVMYLRFSPNLLCNMYVTLCMPMVSVWGFWSEFLWVVLS